jgi:hypothetical protein
MYITFEEYYSLNQNVLKLWLLGMKLLYVVIPAISPHIYMGILSLICFVMVSLLRLFNPHYFLLHLVYSLMIINWFPFVHFNELH